MIKVKIDRTVDNVHIVEDGLTVRYDSENPNVLEVLDEDGEVIALFRDWLYARPAVDEDYEDEDDDDDPDAGVNDLLGTVLQQIPGLPELAEVEVGAPGTVSSGHVNSHGEYEAAGDETEDRAE